MINLKEDIRPIFYVKSHTAEILKQGEDKQNPIIIIQNSEAKAVLINIKYYQDIMD